MLIENFLDIIAELLPFSQHLIQLMLVDWLGATMADALVSHRRWIGLAFTPQAAVALGMTLVAVGHFSDLKETFIAVTIGTTVFFAVIGPALTPLALRGVGEVK